ncbi:hypothetical protein INT45_002904 [Circinella minor]|uniref:Transposase n=1 Tax=Circinella minor TaxID=1195481 RepID=A0A8H7RSF5_9FUNG|nr:hypothetical protein INT45_002904 [Circinella minor]
MFKLKETKYRMCPNRCRLFPQFSNHPCKCKEKQFSPNGKPIATMSYFLLARQLAYFIANNEIRSSLYQTMTQEHSPGMLKDIFDGSVYKELKPNLFPNQSMDDLDLAISLFIDGFASFKGGSSKMTIVHIVFLSLPPNERYKKKNMLQVSIILADHTGNLYSFLNPLMNELFILENAGMEVRFPNGAVKVKVHLLLASGDIVGVQELIHHSGHNSSYGCRQCHIKSVSSISPTGRGNGRYYTGTVNMPQERSNDEFKYGNQEFGIAKATEFAKLKSFHGSSFFGLDEMHLIGANVTKKLWSMISGDFETDVNTTIRLPKQKCLKIGSALVESGRTIPSSIFEGSFRDVSRKAGLMRSVDWIMFLQIVVPTLVFENLVDIYTANSEQVQALMSLVIGCTLALLWEIDDDDIANIEENLHVWHLHMMNNVNFHYLRHIHTICSKLGPLRAYSTRSAERAIGFFKRHIKQRVLPGANAANIIKRQLLLRTFERIYGEEEEVLDDAEEPENFYVIQPTVIDNFENDIDEEFDSGNESEEGAESDNGDSSDEKGSEGDEEDDESPSIDQVELWDFQFSTLDAYSKYNLERYVKKYWHNYFPDNRVRRSTLDQNIRVSERLFKIDTIYRCQEFPSTAKKMDALVKLRLRIKGGGWATYFAGEHPLCLVKIYGNLQMTKYGTSPRAMKTGVPYGHRTSENTSRSDKFYVVHASNIRGYAGLLKSSLHPDRYYVVYPEMIPGDITLGKISKI